MRRLIASLAVLLCAASAAAQTTPDAPSADPDMRIPARSRLYVAPIDGGYDIYLSAAIHKKQVPLIIVTDRSKADFELSGVTESEKAGWAKMLFLGSTSTAEQASIKVINLKTATIVFAYNVNKSNSARGKQSSSESCAKHLKEKIDSGR